MERSIYIDWFHSFRSLKFKFNGYVRNVGQISQDCGSNPVEIKKKISSCYKNTIIFFKIPKLRKIKKKLFIG